MSIRNVDITSHNHSNKLKLKSGSELLSSIIESYRRTSNKYYKILTIVQSTGYGKTKSCFELSKSIRCVYLQCLNKSNNRNVPGVIDLMIKQLKEKPLSTPEKIIYCLSYCASEYEDAQSLHKAHFFTNNFYDKLSELWESVKSCSPKSVRFKEEPSHTDSTSSSLKLEPSDTRSWSYEINNIFNERPNLVIIFDEASELLNTETDMSILNSPIRTLYRQINNGPGGLIGLFLSTSSHVRHFSPNHIGSGIITPQLLDVPAIIEICFFDIFRALEKCGTPPKGFGEPSPNPPNPFLNTPH